MWYNLGKDNIPFAGRKGLMGHRQLKLEMRNGDKKWAIGIIFVPFVFLWHKPSPFLLFAKKKFLEYPFLICFHYLAPLVGSYGLVVLNVFEL